MARSGAVAAALALLALGAVAGGCGEEGGAAPGATVTVYVSGPLRGSEAAAGKALCAGARAELARSGAEVDELRVRVACLDASGPDGEWTLARIGANARRASEDSSAVAYVGEPAAAARRQSQPILETAGIAELGGEDGAAAMRQVLSAIGEGDASEPREAVLEATE